MALPWLRIAKVATLAALSLPLLAGVIITLGFGYVCLNKEKFIFLNEWMPFEDVYIKTRDDVKLHGWLITQPDAQKAPTFICFQGNYGYQGFRLEHAKTLYGIGANILLVDYRGFGRSEGSPTEEGVYLDADAALDFILDNKVVNNKDIFVLGHSLGGAVAVDLASRRGEQRGYMSNIDKVRKLKVPTLFVAAEHDMAINPQHTNRLYEACSSPIKRLQTITWGGHEGYYAYQPEIYTQAIQSFIDEAEAGTSVSLAEDTPKASPDNYLRADDGASVVNTQEVSNEERDKKDDLLLRTQVKATAVLVALCILTYATFAISRRGRTARSTGGGLLGDMELFAVEGQQSYYPFTEKKSPGFMRNWKLSDDESMLDSDPFSKAAAGDDKTAELEVPKQLYT
ncbi:hypothetical protein, conserved [Eimeria brunetti]|uniref:Serine aminopeptidase S33 domain-containing protein n=1 Tax=Eimeria brunetti TaxID=51314 RepID=U6LDM5_9EIME|nr:hypothetical protein, conserved [Eimeria brunetti]